MSQKDFWSRSRVGLVGGGSWGTVLAQMIAENCREVRVWMRDAISARSINATRLNTRYFPDLRLNEKIFVSSSFEKIMEGGLNALIWALPSNICRSEAKKWAPFLSGEEIVLHAIKGIEQGSLKRISEILMEELPIRRVGVVSGPNLAGEIAKGQPAATIVASLFSEVCEAGQVLLGSERFRVYPEKDIIGVEWAGVLKNILALASGALGALDLGSNVRSFLMSRGLVEMVRFGKAMGARESTFLGLAGMGDLLATCTSSSSRNYQVGMRLAKGDNLSQVLKELGSTAEGVRTTESVWRFACEHGIEMPITGGVFRLLNGIGSVQDILHELMIRPS